MPQPALSIVLPCFNEELNIAATASEVLAWMKDTHKNGEVVIVNDGSKDRSAEILRELAAKHPEVHIVTHEKNQGYGIAIRSGCDAAHADIVGFMDSDGQFHAKDLDLLLPHLSDAAFVTGRRAKRADGFLRNSFGKVLGAMNVIMLGLWVRDVNCGMKVFRKDIWNRIRPTLAVEKLFNTEMFLRLQKEGIPWLTINVPHYPRSAGTPTGGSVRVIIRMFKELWDLKRRMM